MNNFVDKSKLRKKFGGGPFGLMRFAFSETEMEIVARMNKKLILIFCGLFLGIAIVLAVGLTIVFSQVWFLAIIAIPLLVMPFLFLEFNEKLTINSNGVESSGVIWPRPCRLLWNEVERVENKGIGIMFFKNEKEKVLIPFAPEVLYVATHYYPRIFQ